MSERVKHLSIAAGQWLIAALVALTVASVGAAALMHMVDPAHYGLWTGPGAFFFGGADASMHAHQVPGRTLYLVAFWTVAVGGMICRELVGYARAARAKAAQGGSAQATRRPSRDARRGQRRHRHG